MNNNSPHGESLAAHTKEKLVNQVSAEFTIQFKYKPQHVTLTPGRINIIGEHTDYNQGLAMPTAIDRWICAVVSKRSNDSSVIYSLNYNDSVVIDPHTPYKFQKIWKQLVVTVIHVLTAQFGLREGVNMVLGSNIPIGCGLSSSSAFVIAITQTLCRLFSIEIIGKKLAHLCQKIEKKALEITCGLLDQYAIILSKKNHFMVIDFHNDTIEYIPVSLAGYSWIVVNSQFRRELSEGAYIQRVNECKDALKILQRRFNISTVNDINNIMLQELKNESNILYKRLRHVIQENHRVRDMKNQLQNGTPDKMGVILRESHESLRLLYEVSCEQIDYIIQLSEDFNGWYGGRIMGGGFGGCSIHLIAEHVVEDFNKYIIANYTKKYNIVPEIMKVKFPGGLC